MTQPSTLPSFATSRPLLCLATALCAAALLAGCKDSPGTPSAVSVASAPAAAASPAAAKLSTEMLAAEGVGFSVGSTLAAHTVYVFFDPQCPHCTELWNAARPLKSAARFVWMPVGLLNDKSGPQGAALLAAADPVAAMNAHEASMQARTGGIAAATGADKQTAAVVSNTAMLTRLGFASIPTIVAKNAQTGALVTHEGAMSTAALASLLGLAVPAAAQGS